MHVLTILAVVCLAQINGPTPATRPAAVSTSTKTTAATPLEKTPWKAIELGGRPVAAPPAGPPQ